MKDTNYSKKTLESYQDYMKNASSATSKFGATLKSVVANIGIMLAITAAVKILDALTVTVEEQQEKVDDLKASYEGLSSEFETLSAKQDLTESEKDRLAYLERRLELDKQILDAETRLLYQKQNGQGSLWDNYVANFDKNSNKAQTSSEFGYKYENSGDILAGAIFYNTKAALDGYDATINKSEKLISQFKTFQDVQKSFMESGDDTWVGIYEKEIAETEEKITDFYDDLLLKYQAYEQEYQEYQSQIDSGVLYGDGLKHAEEQRDLWKESSEGLYEQITAIQKLLGTYDYWKELESLEYFNKDEIVELIGTEEDLDVVTQKLEKDYLELNQWMDENGVSVEALVNHYKNLVSVKEELEEPKQVELLSISYNINTFFVGYL